MPRPPLVIGTWGRINRVHKGPRLYVAYARYRDHDGRTRQMERTGTTAQKAEDALKEALVAHLTLESDDITNTSTIAEVGWRWYEDTIAGRKAENTERWYRHALDHIIIPGVGEYRLREVTVARMDRFIKRVAQTRGPGAAKTTRTVLSGTFSMAAQLGAMKRNPMRDIAQVTRPPRAEVKVLTLAQLQDLRVKMHANQLAVDRDVPGPIDYMLGTGTRIGEALAVRWFDLDLDSEKPTALVRATVVNGRIQEHPKSASSRRRLILPAWLTGELRRRRDEQPPNDLGLVFPSERGTVRDTSNLRRQWRELRDTIGYGWVTPHTFRKSVATLAEDVDLASQQLGHADDRVTRAHYIPKTHEGPDLRDVLETISEPAFTQRVQSAKAGNDGNHKGQPDSKKAS